MVSYRYCACIHEEMDLRGALLPFSAFAAVRRAAVNLQAA